jgi:hypothetical protein
MLKRLVALFAFLAAAIACAQTNFLPGQPLTAAQLNAAFGSTVQTGSLAAPTGSGLVGFQQPGSSTTRTLLSKSQDYVSVLDCGADKTGATDSTTAFAACATYGKALYLPSGTYAINWVPTGRLVVFGDGSTSSIIKPYNTAQAAITYTAKGPYWTYHSEVHDVGFVGLTSACTVTTCGVGFTFSETSPMVYNSADEYANNVKFIGVRFSGLYKGIQFPMGNIGSEFYSAGFTNNYYGVYSINNKWNGYTGTGGGGDIMHAGNKYFYGGEFDSNLCAVYINNTADGFGGFNFSDTIIEGNNIGIYVNAVQGSIAPLSLNNIWFEINGAAGTTHSAVTLDTWVQANGANPPVLNTASFTAHTLYIEGSNFEMDSQGSWITDVYMTATASRLVAHEPRAEYLNGYGGAPSTVVAADSSIQLINPSTNGGLGAQNRVIVTGNVDHKQPLVTTTSVAGARAFITPHRFNKLAGSYGGSGTVQNFTSAVAYTGSFSGSGSVVSDGVIYANANQFAPAYTSTGQYLIFSSTANSVTGWVVVTVDAKWVSGAQPLLSYNDLSTNSLFSAVAVPAQGQWFTIGAIGNMTGAATLSLSVSPATAATSTFDLSAFQARVFPTKQEAQNFLDSMVYVGP